MKRTTTPASIGPNAAEVQRLMDAHEYQKAGEVALSTCEGSLVCALSDTKPAPWSDRLEGYRPHWRCTLTGPGGTYTFDFWASINDGAPTAKAKAWNRPADKARVIHKETGRPVGPLLSAGGRQKGQALVPVPVPPTPTPYDIIACLQWNNPGTFDNFCSDFGYDNDSRRAEATWVAVADQARHLARIFPSEEAREVLSMIQ